MRFLFCASPRGELAGLAKLVQSEGHEVLFQCLNSVYAKGDLKRVTLLEEGIKWKPDVVICERPVEQMDKIRKNLPVFGGGVLAKKLHSDRSFALASLASCGFQVPPLKSFSISKIEDAKRFIEEGPSTVYRPVDSSNSSYVPKGPEDLTWMVKTSGIPEFFLQAKVEGTEFVSWMWFNGDKVPISFNEIQSRKISERKIGPEGRILGRICWANRYRNMAVKELSKFHRMLYKSGYRGPVGIRFIANESGLWALGLDMSLTSFPILELIKNPKGQVFYQLARGEGVKVGWKRELFSIGVNLITSECPKGFPLLGLEEPAEKHFWPAMTRKKEGYHEVHGDVVGTVTANGVDAVEARRRAYRTITNLTLPNLFYRTDIGLGFPLREIRQLRLI